MWVASVASRTAAMFWPTKGTADANDHSGPCTVSSALEVWASTCAAAWSNWAVSPAFDQLGHRGQLRLRRLEVVPHVERLSGERHAGGRDGRQGDEQEQEDAENPRPHAVAAPRFA